MGYGEAEVKTPLVIAAPSSVPPIFEGTSAFELADSVPGTARTRNRRGWIGLAAIAVLGLIALGTLSGFLYAAVAQRDSARHQLAARKAADLYLDMYVFNNGRVMTEYENAVVCDTYAACRTAAEDLASSIKAFQRARSSAVVPSEFAKADSQIGDALSAALVGDQELLSGMDAGDVAKIKEGSTNVDKAILNLAKAEMALAGTTS